MARIARLADDLLDYAGPWAVSGVAVDLAGRAALLRARWLRIELGASGGNRCEAARRLGISRVGLGKKLRRLGLEGAR